MFHYRNRGNHSSSVLIGMNDINNLNTILDNIGYNYSEHTDHIIYNLLL